MIGLCMILMSMHVSSNFFFPARAKTHGIFYTEMKHGDNGSVAQSGSVPVS